MIEKLKNALEQVIDLLTKKPAPAPVPVPTRPARSKRG